MGLNPEEGQAFVSVYIDDILIYSRTLEEHLSLVLERIQNTGLKSKCAFVRQEVEYLGHIHTPDGLKTNPKLAQSVEDIPIPKNVDHFLACARTTDGSSTSSLRSPNLQSLNMLTRKNVGPQQKQHYCPQAKW